MFKLENPNAYFPSPWQWIWVQRSGSDPLGSIRAKLMSKEVGSGALIPKLMSIEAKPVTSTPMLGTLALGPEIAFLPRSSAAQAWVPNAHAQVPDPSPRHCCLPGSIKARLEAVMPMLMSIEIGPRIRCPSSSSRYLHSDPLRRHQDLEAMPESPPPELRSIEVEPKTLMPVSNSLIVRRKVINAQ